jgi:RNA-binding protein YlmH
MNLGIERDCIGDILTDDSGADAYIFIMKDMEDLICKELIRVRHTSVRCCPVPPLQCDLRPSFDIVSGSVASERLDAVLAFVFHISRNEAQSLISRELVFLDGRTVISPGYDLKEGVRVSVRGHGKFRYLGTIGNTRKGRLMINVAVYK